MYKEYHDDSSKYLYWGIHFSDLTKRIIEKTLECVCLCVCVCKRPGVIYPTNNRNIADYSYQPCKITNCVN